MDERAWRLLLWPLGVLYGLAARVRARLYRHRIFPTRRLEGIVISVGNLTAGGTGKTPLVLWIAERLIAHGERPAILTRGYGGSQSRGRAADEVSLLRMRLGERAELGVGKNRYRTGRMLAQGGAKYFLLDDGFQHLALHRDANIVLLDSQNPFGAGLLPGGRLREPLCALARADIVLITRGQCAPAVEAVVQRHTRAPVFYAQTELEAVLRVPSLQAEWPAERRWGARVFAFCGIGNPRAYFNDLERWGFTVAGARAFPDHHRYSRRELQAIEAAAVSRQAGALICTEKDVFNLPDVKAIGLPVYACRIRMKLPEEEAFWKAVQSAIERHKKADRR